MGRIVLMLVCAAALLAGGCAAPAAAPALRPVEARSRLLADPQVAEWYAGHSAPAVLAGLSPRAARAMRKYAPAVMFDQVAEGYRVTLEARVGPAPRRLVGLMDRATGALLDLRPQE